MTQAKNTNKYKINIEWTKKAEIRQTTLLRYKITWAKISYKKPERLNAKTEIKLTFWLQNSPYVVHKNFPHILGMSLLTIKILC